jgi:hypothetical protein
MITYLVSCLDRTDRSITICWYDTLLEEDQLIHIDTYRL